MIKRSIVSVLDQALLSGLNFSIGLYLISNVPKSAYGLYVQLFAVGVLFCGVVDALIANSLVKLSARYTPEEMAPRVALAQGLARYVGVMLALIGGGLAYGLQPAPAGDIPWVLAAVFLVYIAALTFRDFRRILFFLHHRAIDVLKLDAVFVLCAITCGFLLHVTGLVSLVTVFSALALSNAMALVLSPKVSPPARFSLPRWRSMLLECWGISHWALPGLGLGWLGNSLYIYVAGHQLGLAATAELNASRLLLMPLTLLTVAWQQSSRPDIAKLIRNGSVSAFKGFLQKSAVIVGFLSASYLVIIFLAYELISGLVFSDSYVHVDYLLNLWVGYFLIYVVKFSGTVLMAGFSRFLTLFKLTSVAIGVQFLLLLVLPPVFGIEMVIWCLIASELIEAVAIWGYFLPRLFGTMSKNCSMGMNLNSEKKITD